MKIFVGIDIGKNGGIAIMNSEGKLQSTILIHKIANEIDLNRLFKTFQSFLTYTTNKNSNVNSEDVYIVFENLHSIFGSSAKSNFTFGQVNGFIEAFTVACEYTYLKVNPKDWQKVCWQGVKPVVNVVPKFKTLIGGGKKIQNGTREKIDTKLTSLLAAQRLFSNWNFKPMLKTKESANNHDGLVDAALLSYYCYLRFK